MKSLKEKVVVVTGAGSGMGREIALLCASKGAVVAAGDYRLDGVKETAALIEENGGRCSVHQADVSQLPQVKKFAKDVAKKHKRVDVLFNNAGIMPKFQKFEKIDYKVYEKIFAVNVYGVIYCSREFIPYLLRQEEAALVNTSSAAGLVGYLGLTPYVASKFAVRGFTESLRMEYLKTGLTVSVVFPGAIATNIVKNSPLMTDKEKKALLGGGGDGSAQTLSASNAAKIIVEGMMAKRTKIIVGKDAKMQDLIARLRPEGYTAMFYDKMKDLLPMD